MDPFQLLVPPQLFAIIQGKVTPIQPLLIASLLENTVHRFNYSAFSHGRGIQCLDKQHVIATLKAIHFLQAAAVSLKLLRFFFFSSFVYVVECLISPSCLQSLGGKIKTTFAIMLQRRAFSNSFSKPFCKPFQIPFVEVRNLAFSLCLCRAEATQNKCLTSVSPPFLQQPAWRFNVSLSTAA